MTIIIVLMMFVFAVILALMIAILVYKPKTVPVPEKKEAVPQEQKTAPLPVETKEPETQMIPEQKPAEEPAQKEEQQEIKDLTSEVNTEEPGRQEAEEESQPEIKPEKKEEPVDYSVMGERLTDDLLIRFPNIKIFMEIHSLDHGLLLQWQGHARENETMVLSIMNEECRYACIEAVQRIYENSEVTQCGLDLLLPYTDKLEAQACQECQNYLNDQEKKIAGVLMDGSDNENLLHLARCQALIGVNSGSCREYKVNGNPRKIQTWIDHLQPSNILPLRVSEQIKKVVTALKEQIPWEIRFELSVSQQKGIKDLLTIMPDAWVWMRASVEKKNDALIVRAPDQQLLDEACRILEEDASKNSLYLVSEKDIKASPAVPNDDWFYQRIEHAVSTSLTIKGIVPVTISETGALGQFPGWKVCRYLPLTENKKESSEAVIFFYRTLVIPA